VGLLTKIFGNPEGGGTPSAEPSTTEQAPAEASAPDLPSFEKGDKRDPGSSGIRPAVEPTPARPQAARAHAPNRRPEHPRMYLRPSPTVLDPALPGSTRRQQISVRSNGKETAGTMRGPGAASSKRPLSERSLAERSLSERAPSERSHADRPATERPGSERPVSGRPVSMPDKPARRELASEPGSSPSSRPPPPSRPRPAMVVSPVSLTPEELQEQCSSRPKMPTLVGLGTAVGTPPLPEVAPVGDGLDRRGGHRSKSSAAPLTASSLSEEDVLDDWSAAEGTLVHASGTAPRDVAQFDAVTGDAVDTLPPEDITPFVRALADFAIELSLGPVSRLWLPEVRRSAEALRLTAQHRGEAALNAVSERLLELLRVEPAVPSAELEAADSTVVAEPRASESGASESGASESGASESGASESGASESGASESGASVPASSEAPSNEPALAEPFDGRRREQILHEVTRLSGLLAEWPAHAQDLREEARRRETRIVRELLANFDGIKRDHRARAEEQMSLEQLAGMSAEALAEELELSIERGDELRLALEAHREGRRQRAPDPGQVAHSKRALEELEASTLAFDTCDPEQKSEQRQLRDERRQAMARVNLLLAERGELEWLDALDAMSFAERIERLKRWFESAERPT
jgi:hypothetical protein